MRVSSTAVCTVSTCERGLRATSSWEDAAGPRSEVPGRGDSRSRTEAGPADGRRVREAAPRSAFTPRLPLASRCGPEPSAAVIKLGHWGQGWREMRVKHRVDNGHDASTLPAGTRSPQTHRPRPAAGAKLPQVQNHML